LHLPILFLLLFWLPTKSSGVILKSLSFGFSEDVIMYRFSFELLYLVVT